MTRTRSLGRPMSRLAGGACALLLLFAACSSDTPEYDPYHDWRVRNEVWFAEAMDSARTAIREARAAHGGDWEEHCDWRILKSVLRSPGYQSGIMADSVCAHILRRGTGTVSPAYSDSIRLSFRGSLLPTVNAESQTEELVFSQTYYGDYDAATAAPQLALVSDFAEGYATALQYMVEGDDWVVYIPQQLFYGETANGVIPAYSTVRFRIHLSGVYPLGTPVPAWK